MSEPETPKSAQEKRDDEHWTVRRQRMVKCKVHGLHYDPRLTSGCAKCRKEGLVAAPPREKPQFLPLLLLIFAIVLIFYSVFLPGLLKQPTEAEVIVPETQTAHELDPAGYREAIETVETALYDNPGTDLAQMADDARLSLTALSARLKDSPDQIGHQAAREVEAVKACLPEDSVTVDDFERARSKWPTLRSRYFSPASWFRHLDGGEADDRVTLAAYRDLAGDLLALVDEGSARVVELSSPQAPPGDPGQLDREWRSYRQDWLGRLKTLRSRLPDRPGIDADSEVLIATQRLEKAFSQATSLAEARLDPGTVSRFEAALSLTEQAQRSFDDILLR